MSWRSIAYRMMDGSPENWSKGFSLVGLLDDISKALAPPAPPSVSTADRTATAQFARIFDLLSLRDPTLNATLYEDPEFAGILRDFYAQFRSEHDVVFAAVERTMHKCGQQAWRIPVDEWCLDYEKIEAAARAEVATKARGENPCRVCGESTLKAKVQVRTDDDYLPAIHVQCVEEEDQHE